MRMKGKKKKEVEERNEYFLATNQQKKNVNGEKDSQTDLPKMLLASLTRPLFPSNSILSGRNQIKNHIQSSYLISAALHLVIRHNIDEGIFWTLLTMLTMFSFCLIQATFLLFVASHSLLGPAVNVLVKAGKTYEILNGQPLIIPSFICTFSRGKIVDEGKRGLRRLN